MNALLKLVAVLFAANLVSFGETQTNVLRQTGEVPISFLEPAVRPARGMPRGVTGAVDVTEPDLLPYFKGARSIYDFVPPVVDERYRINPYGVPVEAVLTVYFHGLKPGTVMRLGEGKSPNSGTK
jgi:hypothetical protein